MTITRNKITYGRGVTTEEEKVSRGKKVRQKEKKKQGRRRRKIWKRMRERRSMKIRNG